MAEMTDAEFDRMVEEANERGREFERNNPQASAARYDATSGRLIIDFANGSTLLVPARQLQDLQDVSDADLAGVELSHGYYLRWDTLDVDFTVPGLLAGLFGTAKFMAQRAGQARSPAKAAAARENGRKGGRPRRSA